MGMGYYMRAVAVALVLSISTLSFAASSVTIAYDDAADAINEAENARVSAVQACQCNDSSDDSSSDSKTVSDNCTMLAKQALDYDSSKSRRSGKTKSAK